MKKIILFCIIVSLSACAKHTTIRHQTDFQSAFAKERELILLPPEAVVQTSDIVGKTKRMHNYEYHVEDLILDITPEITRNKGYHIVKMSKTEAQKKSIGRELSRLRDAYNQAIGELYASPLMKEEYAFAIEKSISKAARDFGKKTDQPVVMLADYSNFMKTNGARTRDFMIGVLSAYAGGSANMGPSDQATMLVGFVDTKDGSVLWTNRASVASGMFGGGTGNAAEQEKYDRTRLTALLTDALQKFPNR